MYPDQRVAAIDLAHAAQSCALELVPKARDKAIDLSLEAAQPCNVMGNELLIHELVSNLIDNAISHGCLGGTVAVRVMRREERVVLEVEDDGPGIPIAERDRVFDRFYRAPGARQGRFRARPVDRARHLHVAPGDDRARDAALWPGALCSGVVRGRDRDRDSVSAGRVGYLTNWVS